MSVQVNISPPALTPSTPSDDGISSIPHSEKDEAAAPRPSTPAAPLEPEERLLSALKDVRHIIRLVQCPVCSRVLQNPATLPCGNSICKGCIPQTHRRTNISWPATANRLHGFGCPISQCAKEHAVGDCAVDVTLNKALANVRTAVEKGREANRDSNMATYIFTQNRWEVAGLSTLEEKHVEETVLKGGRIIATYTLADSGKLEYGCEVLYSSVGASDDDVTNVDVEIFTKLKESVRTEMDCQVCYGLFLDPMTTSCGHTFCRSCLHRVLDHSELCPICRRQLSIQAQVNPQSFPSNARLNKIIDGFWADLVALRSQAHRLEQQATHGGFDVPIFVCTLSFPAMPTFLHVFEPRYRLMMRRAMDSDRTFGMVAAAAPSAAGEPGFVEIGTLLRIVNIEFFPDGRSLLETRGVSRFRLTRHGYLDGYVVGNIEKIDDISVAEEEAMEASETLRGSGVRDFVSQPRPSASTTQIEHTSRPRSPPTPAISLDDLDAMSTVDLVNMGVDFVERMRSQSVSWLTTRVLHIFGDCPRDPAIFPWWFASVLPVKDEEKYRLLGTSSVRERLKICCRWIVEWESSRWTISDCLVL